MMIKLTKEDVEEACSYWLRGTKRYANKDDMQVMSNDECAVIVDHRMLIYCKHTRSGVECKIAENVKPK